MSGESSAIARLNDYGQSPWYDNLARPLLTGGGLAKLVDVDGIRGVTSNPTILDKAIGAGEGYDEQLAACAQRGLSIEDTYWDVVLDDIVAATDVLRPVFDAHDGGDGFVSVEVAPTLAHDTAGTIAAAQSLHQRVDRPNVMIKIPATLEGIPAIEETIASGITVNVTLIFSLDRHAQVIEAYLTGLERLLAAGGDPSTVASVASFFVSRVDTETDRRLPEGSPLRGKAAVANAKLAYELFRSQFSGARWDALAAKGARLQRPLWASTSTKNPAYSPTLYVDELIGPDTVNTLAPASIEALQHGEGHAARRNRGRGRRAGPPGDGRSRRRRRRHRRRDRHARARGCRFVRGVVHRRVRHHRETPRRSHRLRLIRGRVGELRRGAEVGGEFRRRDPGVEAAGARHHVGGTAADPAGLLPRHRLAVDRGAPSRQPDEAHRARLQPRHHALDPCQPGPVLVARELVGAGGRPLHQVGHADAVVDERASRVAGNGDELRGHRRGPEAVAGPCETETGVG